MLVTRADLLVVGFAEVTQPGGVSFSSAVLGRTVVLVRVSMLVLACCSGLGLLWLGGSEPDGVPTRVEGLGFVILSVVLLGLVVTLSWSFTLIVTVVWVPSFLSVAMVLISVIMSFSVHVGGGVCVSVVLLDVVQFVVPGLVGVVLAIVAVVSFIASEAVRPCGYLSFGSVKW